MCNNIFLGIYYCPGYKEYNQIVDHIQELPLVTKPNIFGLHENADLIKERQESESLLHSVLKTQVNLIKNYCLYVINYNYFFKYNFNCKTGPNSK